MPSHFFIKPFRFGALVCLALGLSISTAASAPLTADSATSASLSLSFVPNVSHSAPEVQFQARGMGGSLYFMSDGVTFVLPGESKDKPGAALQLEFEGANADTSIQAADQLPGVVNTFIGNDPAEWQSNIPTYGSISYAQLYPGIDLRYEGIDGTLKGTYTVSAGADASLIGWHYTGGNDLHLDAATGDLQIALADGKMLTENAPLVWQDISGQHVPVSAGYALEDGNRIHFTLGNYDRNYPLTIDPTMQYSTYIGGSGLDSAWGVAADANGFAFVSGTTESINFPVSAGGLGNNVLSGSRDIFVVKIDTNASGAASKVWATYLGGTGAEDYGQVAVDPSGNVYVAGSTSSADFPGTAVGFQQLHGLCCAADSFLAKLDPSGSSLLYSTYNGGNLPEESLGLAVDSSGHAYISGYTKSDNFPVTASAYDSTNLLGHSKSFVTKIDTNATGAASLLYATYFGGNNDTDIVGRGLAADDAGNVYLSGRAKSTDFPITANAYQSTLNGGAGYVDAFVARLDTTQSGAASLVYSSYLGGGSGENANGPDNIIPSGVATDGNGKVYITGETNSTDFPLVNAYQPIYGGDPLDSFVAAIDTNAFGYHSLIYSTYLGGNHSDQGYGLAYAGEGVIYVTGVSASGNFPLLFPLHAAGTGYLGTYVTKIDTQLSGGGSLIASTFIALPNNSAGAIALDDKGTAYLSGQTTTNNFPTLYGFQTTYGLGGDAFLFKLGFAADLETTQTVSDNPALTGNNLTINAAVKNNGPDSATGVTLSETLPANVDYVSAVPDSGSCTYTAPDVVCDPGDIFRNVTWHIVITVVPQSGAQASFTAHADGIEKDTVSSNDTAANTVSVVVFTDQVPVLLSPGDGANPATNPFTLNWSPVLGAAEYTVMFGSSDPPLTVAATVTGTSYTFPSPLPDGISYWQVQAVNSSSQVTHWSDPRSVNIVSAPDSTAGRNYFTSAPTLTWNLTSDALGYEVEVSNKSTFSSVIYSDDTLPADQFFATITTPLPSGTYYWHVRAKISATKWSSWSATETFMVNAP